MANHEDGPLAKFFCVVGLVAGAIGGAQTGDPWGLFLGAFILGGIGYWVGTQADALIARLLFILGAIISLLINSAIRRFIWALIFQS